LVVSWKWKHVSVSIASFKENGNAFPFPLLVSRNDETETRFCFHVHLPPKQKHISIFVVRESKTETSFRFHLSVVSSAKNDLAGAGKIARDRQICLRANKRISSQCLGHIAPRRFFLKVLIPTDMQESVSGKCHSDTTLSAKKRLT
jgi:hypothetical protein